MPCIAHTSRSLLKGSDTAQPRILALQHLTQPAPGTVEFLQGLGIISMPKSLWPQGTSGQEASLRERAEHRQGRTPHLDSLQFLSLSSSQRSGEHQLLSVLELQQEPRPPFPTCQPNAQIAGLPNSWLPVPFSWTEAAMLN